MNKAGFLRHFTAPRPGLCCPSPLAASLLTAGLKRYYEPLQLPIQPGEISGFPYIHRFIALCYHHIGSPVLHCHSADTCHPCYPGSSAKMIPLSYLGNNGLPHMTTRSASPNSHEATHRCTYATACIFGVSHLAPAHRKLTNPWLPRRCFPVLRRYGQFPLQDFNLRE